MMPLSEIFFFGIVFYILYKFVFNLFLPIVKTTRSFKEQFRNMRDNMQDPTNPANPFQRTAAPQNAAENAPPKKPDPSHSTGKMGEYIDFEEIK